MKRFLIVLMLASLPPIACSIGPTPDIEATVRVAVAATLTAQNTEAPAPKPTHPLATDTSALPAFTPLPPTPTPTPLPPTPTPIPTWTGTPSPVPPAASPTPAPPTATLPPALPTYSEVVSTYPANANLCLTDAELVGGDGDSFQFAGSLSIRNGQFVYQCYGTKITVQVDITLDGKAYAPGTKLTVDKDLEWIEVSSWD